MRWSTRPPCTPRSTGTTLEAALARDPRLKGALSGNELGALLDPTTYVGLAPELVDRALAQTKAEGWLD